MFDWLSFNTSNYLYGVLAALIPLLIHLSRSRRTKKMRFSTTRFFTEQFLRSYRMSRLREVLLLACRMALFAFLAMALAGPVLHLGEHQAVQRSGEETRTVVLVIDDSASMNYSENGSTLLAQAKASARQVIGGLRGGDRVGIMLAGQQVGKPKLLLPLTEKPGNEEQARKFQETLDKALNDIRIVQSAPLKLTDKSVAALRAAGVPESVLGRISDLKGQEFETRNALAQKLTGVLDKQQQARSLNLVMDHFVKTETDEPDRIRAVGTDLRGALAAAETLLSTPGTRGPEVYVFSDLQDSGWGGRPLDRPSDEAKQISYIFVQARPQQPIVHVALTAVQYGAARPLAGVPFSFQPTVSIQGDIGQDTIKVSLYVYEKDRDGRWLYADEESKVRKVRQVAEQVVRSRPDSQWSTPVLRYTFDNPGWQAGFLEVEVVSAPGEGKDQTREKTSLVDNRRYFALEVLDSVEVLAVNGAPSQIRTKDELFFLRLALTASPEGQESHIRIKEYTPANLAGAFEEATTSPESEDMDRMREKYPLIVLANVESLPEPALKKLEDYTAAGGSLLFFLGDKVNPEFYNESLHAANRRYGGLLPCKLGTIKTTNPDARDLPYTGGIDYDHPALSAFADERFATLVGPAFSYRSFWQVDPDPDSSAVLMETNTQAPLLLEKNFGKGRVMLFTSTCNRNWNVFPVRPAFLPWTHRLVTYLAQQPGSQQAFFETGDEVNLIASGARAGEPLRVRRPTGEEDAPTGKHPKSGEPLYATTEQPGIYSVITPDSKEVNLFAVNLENYESKLTYLDDTFTEKLATASDADRKKAIEKGLEQKLGRERVAYVADPTRPTEAGIIAPPQEWARWVLLVVLLICLFEPWLANQISARLFARRKPAPAFAGGAPAAGEPPGLARWEKPAGAAVPPKEVAS
jgi:hypothetical protein